jgi:hypothetical protein
MTPNTTYQEPQSSIVSHIALYLVQWLALASPPFRYRRALFTTLIVALAAYALTHPYLTNDVSLAQPFNISWSFYLATLVKLNLPDLIEENYWRIGRPAREATSYAAFGYRKLRWTSALLLNTRLIRWNQEVKNVPHRRKQSRISFLASQTLQVAKNMLVADLLFQIGIRIF